MDDPAPFIAAIADAWDDPAPILIYADWLEERGDESHAYLRWCASEVLPAIASAREPRDADAVYLGSVYEWNRVYRRDEKRLRVHPQAAALCRFANVVMCRHPQGWRSLPEGSRELIATLRLSALGLASPDELRQAKSREAQAMRAECHALYSPKAAPTVRDARRMQELAGRKRAIDAAKADASRFQVVAPQVGPAMSLQDARRLWGALHRELANVPPRATSARSS